MASMRCSLALCVIGAAACAAAPAAKSKTNVILFVIDDLGWADLAFKDFPPAMERVAGVKLTATASPGPCCWLSGAAR